MYCRISCRMRKSRRQLGGMLALIWPILEKRSVRSAHNSRASTRAPVPWRLQTIRAGPDRIPVSGPTRREPSQSFSPCRLSARNDNGVGKIDYCVNDKHTINGMYHYGTGALTVPPSAGFAGVPTTSIPFSQTFSAQAELVSGAWNWAVSSTRINEFRLGYAHYHQEYTSVDANVNPLAYGINTGATDPKTFGIPSIGITGYGSFGGSQHKIVGPDNIIQLLDHFSLVHGAFTLSSSSAANLSTTPRWTRTKTVVARGRLHSQTSKLFCKVM